MSISCDCDGGGDYDWYYTAPQEYSKLETSRRQRCYSCRELIDLGADVGAFPSWKVPSDDIEVEIYGEDGEIPRATKYMCETCTGLYWAVTELGFCISMEKGESMRGLAKLSQTGDY
jgi:hypothetical protein